MLETIFLDVRRIALALATEGVRRIALALAIFRCWNNTGGVQRIALAPAILRRPTGTEGQLPKVLETIPKVFRE